MTKYTIFSDYHLGAPYAFEKDFVFGKNVVFLGDNFDIKNTLRKKLPEMKKLKNKIYKKAKKTGTIFIDGNHELIKLNYKKDFVKIGQVLFLHGDVIAYGIKKAKRWRSKKEGVGILYWRLLKIYKSVFKGELNKLNKKQLKIIREFVQKNKINTIIFGHFHPKKLQKFEVDGIKIFMIPRGKTILKI